ASDTDGLVNPNDLKEIMETMNMHEKNPFLYNIILNLCSDQETLQKGKFRLIRPKREKIA
ncbi:MAG: hypothetical protein II547_05005, partial [Treponema sp.]|nr:hypothetical protein [Treponema sp.]